jgi:hypothetical protein
MARAAEVAPTTIIMNVIVDELDYTTVSDKIFN